MKRLALVLVALVVGSSLPAADWPAWRGPTGQGHCEEKNLPLKWSDTSNVKWKVPLAEESNSTPVVWGDRIFHDKEARGGAKRSLLCLARGDGHVLWQRDIDYPDKETAYQPTWYCNASPVLDAERVVVSFASAGMYCFDHAGKELWK